MEFYFPGRKTNIAQYMNLLNIQCQQYGKLISVKSFGLLYIIIRCNHKIIFKHAYKRIAFLYVSHRRTSKGNKAPLILNILTTIMKYLDI